MPLGIEPNGISAGLIERGGDFLAQSIIKTGETIEGALIRGQAFRQAREFGQQLSQVDPNSDEWPQKAAYLTSQYPLAVQSGLAQKIMEPMAKSFAGFQAAKRADNTFGNNVALENLRSRHAMDRVEARPGSTGAMPINFNTDPLQGDVTPGQSQGISGVLQDTFSAMKGDQPAPQVETNAGVLPALGAIPDAASGMRQRSQRELTVLRDMSNENKASQTAGGPSLWNTKNSPMEINRRLRDEDKANAPASDLHESTVVPGLLLNKAGTPFVPTEGGGIARPGGQYEKQRLEQNQKAADYRQQRDVQTDAMKETARTEKLKMWQESNEGKALKATADLLKERETREVKTLRDFETEERKNTDDAQRPALRAKVVAQQKLAQETKDSHTAAAAAYSRMMNAAGTIFKDEAEARAAGLETNDVFMMINPATGKPGKARLK